MGKRNDMPPIDDGDEMFPVVPPKSSEADARGLCDIVPESPASEGMMDLLTNWQHFVKRGRTELQLRDGTKIELVPGEKSAMLRLTRKTEKSLIIAQIPDVEVMTTKNIAPKRLFNYLLLAVKKVIGDDGKPTVDRLVFPLQNIIDIGMYDTERSARTGFETGMNVLEQLWVGGRIYHGAKVVSSEMTRLFIRHKITQQQCAVDLNTKADWNFIAQYRMVLAKFYYKLGEHAGDLFRYIMYCARQNVDLLKSKKPFYMGLDRIHEKMGLPPLDNVNTPTRDIKVAIDDALEEIEEKFREIFHYPGLQLLLVSKDGKDLDSFAIRNYIGQGQLRVLITGGLLKLLVRVSGANKRPKKAPPTTIEAEVSDTTPYTQNGTQ